MFSFRNKTKNICLKNFELKHTLLVTYSCIILYIFLRNLSFNDISLKYFKVQILK